MTLKLYQSINYLTFFCPLYLIEDCSVSVVARRPITTVNYSHNNNCNNKKSNNTIVAM